MIVIDILGAVLIALIIWWFLIYKSDAIKLSESNNRIRVENGTYHPASLEIAPRKAVRLQFVRIDPSACAEKVVFPDLNLSESLPINTEVSIDLPALEPGEYPFHCQMNMYRGKLIVREV